ncbi:MAG: hypothetical protein ACOYYS_25035 [Chloroflexota bacterium]
MHLLTPCHITLFMAASLFFLGLGTAVTGVIVLVNRACGRDMHTLAVQTTRIAQKGLAEDIAGLVGNANSLLATLNAMAQTAAGIGIFLTLLGLGIVGLSFWLVFQARVLCTL